MHRLLFLQERLSRSSCSCVNYHKRELSHKLLNWIAYQSFTLTIVLNFNIFLLKTINNHLSSSSYIVSRRTALTKKTNKFVKETKIYHDSWLTNVGNWTMIRCDAHKWGQLNSNTVMTDDHKYSATIWQKLWLMIWHDENGNHSYNFPNIDRCQEPKGSYLSEMLIINCVYYLQRHCRWLINELQLCKL